MNIAYVIPMRKSNYSKMGKTAKVIAFLQKAIERMFWSYWLLRSFVITVESWF